MLIKSSSNICGNQKLPLQQQDLVKTAVRSVRGALVALLGFSLVINLLMLSGPLFMLQIYDRILPSQSIPTLAVMAVLVVMLYVVFGLLKFDPRPGAQPCCAPDRRADFGH